MSKKNRYDIHWVDCCEFVLRLVCYRHFSGDEWISTDEDGEDKRVFAHCDRLPTNPLTVWLSAEENYKYEIAESQNRTNKLKQTLKQIRSEIAKLTDAIANCQKSKTSQAPIKSGTVKCT